MFVDQPKLMFVINAETEKKKPTITIGKLHPNFMQHTKTTQKKNYQLIFDDLFEILLLSLNIKKH